MTDLEQFAKKNLQGLEDIHQYRELIEVTRTGKSEIVVREQNLSSFCCNDYFALSNHPLVKAAAIAAINQYGVGAASSRLVTGNHPCYTELEQRLARLHNCEAACVFGSGYLANLGAITALAFPGDLILADKLVHASIIDGARLSGAKFMRFNHNDLAHAEGILTANRHLYHNCLIITEGVFSMDGDLAPLEPLAALAKRNNAWLISDNAHLLDFQPLPLDLHIGTLSKYIGSYGGYLCGSNTLIDYIKNKARSFIFSTALPAVVIAAASMSVKIIAENTKMHMIPLQYAQYFTEQLGLKSATSQIVPLIIGDEEKTLQLSSALKTAGFLVIAIRPPTVAKGSSRLRFTFSSAHSFENIDRLIAVLKPLLLN